MFKPGTGSTSSNGFTFLGLSFCARIDSLERLNFFNNLFRIAIHADANVIVIVTSRVSMLDLLKVVVNSPVANMVPPVRAEKMPHSVMSPLTWAVVQNPSSVRTCPETVAVKATLGELALLNAVDATVGADVPVPTSICVISKAPAIAPIWFAI
jgi:hypothetical protein